ncbi:MAG: UDP-N-acetylglucosamine 2-epimerase (hydrolyzing) [Deltaproteobacteria bacterium]|nr:UDP-N-acetylglucosamine 2-epimerase (hydrolyzing) [Deltaproteobacteria bacterium]
MKIAVLTTGRQDWGILTSTCERLRADQRFDLQLLVGGMHLSEAHGSTVDDIVAAGFEIEARMPWLDGGASASVQMGRAIALLGERFERHRPDALLLVGDRFETAAAALSAAVAGIPVIHLHGGEETAGAFDDALRHAVTKLSHLHLVSHEQHRARVIAMGEDPGAVFVVGAPGLDQLHRPDLPDRGALESFLGLELQPPVVVVTVHPETLATESAAAGEAVCAAMDEVDATYVITLPNVDPGHEKLRASMTRAGDGPRRVAVEALGAARYAGLLGLADAALGNSSSALIEAPAVGLPAVNVGDRQKGRVRGANVIDVASDVEAVAQALRTALSPEFRAKVASQPGPFGDGRASEQIVDILANWKPPNPPRKPPILIPFD